MKRNLKLGRWSEDELNDLIYSSSKIKEAGSRIDHLSGRFIDSSYSASTLIGSHELPEELVVSLDGVDCFTFIDYIEAMRLSRSFSDFIENLKKVRYREGQVSFKSRNHFFTDWIGNNSLFVKDITKEIGSRTVERTIKHLNKRDDGTFIIKGIDPVWRDISSLPSGNIDDVILDKLKTGDYVGIYSKASGLDVSHVGILIKTGKDIFLRHASSIKGKVIDEDFKEYVSNKAGIIVLRPIG
ncbi:MAG: DUF1460 domain-containing protein [Thermodesulfovibrionia bacterium]|nr:DUF1460 domain-containing protein [Thermodesulfovibrionia bacterium]